MGRSRPGQADDDDGRRKLDLERLGVAAHEVLEAQPCLQQADQAAPARCSGRARTARRRPRRLATCAASRSSRLASPNSLSPLSSARRRRCRRPPDRPSSRARTRRGPARQPSARGSRRSSIRTSLIMGYALSRLVTRSSSAVPCREDHVVDLPDISGRAACPSPPPRGADPLEGGRSQNRSTGLTVLDCRSLRLLPSGNRGSQLLARVGGWSRASCPELASKSKSSP